MQTEYTRFGGILPVAGEQFLQIYICSHTYVAEPVRYRSRSELIRDEFYLSARIHRD